MVLTVIYGLLSSRDFIVKLVVATLKRGESVAVELTKTKAELT